MNTEAYNTLYTRLSNVTPPQALALIAQLTKREEQQKQWGEQNWPPEVWLAILTEEVGEYAQAVLHDKYGGRAAGTAYAEMRDIAAVALQILEWYHRGGPIES